MRSKLAIGISLILLFGFLTCLQAFAIDPQEFGEIREVSQYFKKLCPPETCVILGVGRSPTPYLAYLQDEAPQYVWSLPLSKFKYGEGDNENLNDSQKGKLFDHFSNYLPEKVFPTDKKILVIDFCTTCDGLVASKKHLEEFLKKRNPHIKVDSAGVSATSSSPLLHPEVLNYADLGGSQLGKLHDEHAFDKRSPYGEFDLNKDPILEKKVSPEFLALTEEIQKAKKHDSAKNTRSHLIKFKEQKSLLDIPFEKLTQADKQRLSNSLRRINPVKRTELFIKLLKDPEFEVQESACSNLASYNESYKKYFFQFAIKDSDLHLCLAKQLASYSGNKADQVEFYKKLMESPNENARMALLDRFYEFSQFTWAPDPVNIVEFAALSLDSKFEDVKLKSIKIMTRALHERKSLDSSHFFEKIVSLTDPKLHREALRAIQGATPENLMLLLKSKDQKVRIWAAKEIKSRNLKTDSKIMKEVSEICDMIEHANSDINRTGTPGKCSEGSLK